MLLFQKDLIPSRARGLLRMTDEARRLVDGLRGADRAAVLSFDSHLRLWADFTGERAALRRALTRGVLFGEGSADAGAAAGEPRLLGRLDPAEARRAASLEKALTLLGEALAPLEGSKSVWTWEKGLYHLPHCWGSEALSYRTDLYKGGVANLSYGSLWDDDVKGHTQGRGVFRVDWTPQGDPEALGARLMREYDVQPRTDCSTCHR